MKAIEMNEDELDLILTGLELIDNEIDSVMANKSTYPALFGNRDRKAIRERRAAVHALANRLSQT